MTTHSAATTTTARAMVVGVNGKWAEVSFHIIFYISIYLISTHGFVDIVDLIEVTVRLMMVNRGSDCIATYPTSTDHNVYMYVCMYLCIHYSALFHGMVAFMSPRHTGINGINRVRHLVHEH